jgi:hypothetical protein
MALLPSHLDRTLHAACGAMSETGQPAVVVADILERMGDPPTSAEVNQWLGELVRLGLIEPKNDGWIITADGWRAVNLLPRSEAD